MRGTGLRRRSGSWPIRDRDAGGASPRAVPALPSGSARQAVSEAEARAAATRAIALLQQSMTTWESKRSCASCHHQHLPRHVCCGPRASAAWPSTSSAARQTASRLAAPATNLDFAVQAVMQVDPTLDSGSWLNSLADIGVKPTLATQVFARRILSRQLPDGHWGTIDVRPPQSYSVVTATAVAARAIQRYLPASMDAERRAATDRARGVAPEGRAGGHRRARAAASGPVVDRGTRRTPLEPQVRALVAAQRADGGWAQLPRLGSDAYATGQALVALQRAGGLDASHPSVRRGLAYLLSQQREDGSWLVETRLHEQDLVSPPYFETGFPHGPHQIISAMGTTWAAMALLESLPVRLPRTPRCSTVFPWTRRPSSRGCRRRCSGRPRNSSGCWTRASDANSRTPAGTTVVDDGGDTMRTRSRCCSRAAPMSSALSDARHNALMVSANHARLARRDAAAPRQGRLAGGAAGACRIAQASLADALRDLVR